MSSNSAKIQKPPMLPPKKIAPDPDYEIIDFSNDQYTNAHPIKSASEYDKFHLDNICKE